MRARTSLVVRPSLRPSLPRSLRLLVRTGIVCLGAITLSGCSDSPPPPTITPDPVTLRTTGLGDVVGFVSDRGAHVWRGLPFAAPPVGELRWRAPRPPEPWTGTREAIAFGSPCVQFAGPGGSREDLEPDALRGSEDCLYLNVFAPPIAPDAVWQDADRLPVMLWIHGGGNTIGDALIYDASKLAISEQVVVVTVHYRMGLFGWFYHEALHGDDATLGDRSGNFGTLDTVAALAWVRDHIKAFGGDPDRVTVFGESAGGSNVFALLASPRAAGLFHRAIVQSGSGTTVPIAEARNPVDASPPGRNNNSSELLFSLLVQEGQAPDRAAARARAADMSASAIAAFLRSRSADQLLDAVDGAGFGGMYGWPSLVRDGAVLPEVDLHEAFATGRYNAVPTILGTNRDENKLFMAFGSPHVTTLGPIPVWINDGRMYDLNAEYGSKSWKARGADGAADAIVRSGRSPVWVYRFDWDEEGSVLWLDLSRLFGAAHALEIPFVFGTLNLGPASDYVFPEESHAEAMELAETMMDYWGRFARTGDPGGPEAVAPWPAWKAGDGRFLRFDSKQGGGLALSGDTVTRQSVIDAVASDPRFETVEERCEVYGGLAAFGRSLSVDEYREVLDGACAEIPLPTRG